MASLLVQQKQIQRPGEFDGDLDQLMRQVDR